MEKLRKRTEHKKVLIIIMNNEIKAKKLLGLIEMTLMLSHLQ